MKNTLLKILIGICISFTFISSKSISNENGNSYLTLITFHHASSKQIIYEIDDLGHLKVSNIGIFDKQKQLVYYTKIKPENLKLIDSINFNDFENLYWNKCILQTSGLEISIVIDNKSLSKNIHLHHFYKAEVENLIDLINKSLPNEFHIDYLSPTTKQDCK